MFVSPPVRFPLLNEFHVGRRLGITSRAAMKLLRSGALRTIVLPGDRIRVRQEMLDAYIRQQEAAGDAPSPSDPADDSSPVPPVERVCDDATHRQTAAGGPVAE